MTSLLVASGIGVIGVVPALAAGNSPAPAAFQSQPDDDRGHGRGHDRWFRDRGDMRYVWYEACEGTGPGSTTTSTTATTTTTAADSGTSTDTVAQDALAAAIDGATDDTATTTTTDTSTESSTTTTETSSATDSDDEKYPMFVVVPRSKDEAKAIRKLDERGCYNLTNGEVEGSDDKTSSTDDSTATTTTETTTTETTTTAPATN